MIFSFVTRLWNRLFRRKTVLDFVDEAEMSHLYLPLSSEMNRERFRLSEIDDDS